MLLIRHAESEWNRLFGQTRIDPGIPDAALTVEGREAARAIVPTLAAEGVQRIITSPYRRTLETAAILAEGLGLPVTVEPLVRERCAFSCDEGSLRAALSSSWPSWDFAHLEDQWWGRPIESMDALRARADRFLELAAAMPDRDRLLVVSHWGFIRCVTGAEVGNLATMRVAFAPPADGAGDGQDEREVAA